MPGGGAGPGGTKSGGRSRAALREGIQMAAPPARAPRPLCPGPAWQQAGLGSHWLSARAARSHWLRPRGPAEGGGGRGC